MHLRWVEHVQKNIQFKYPRRHYLECKSCAIDVMSEIKLALVTSDILNPQKIFDVEKKPDLIL